MINLEFIYLLPCLFSLIASIIGFFAFKRYAKTISVISSVLCILSVIIGFWEPLIQNSYLYVDNLSKIFSLMISIVYLSVVIFSIEYINHIENKLIKVHQYFSLLNIFVSALFASVVLNNLGLIWVGIEATTFTSALLVSTQNDSIAVEAAYRYIIIVSVGLIISLIATLFIYSSEKTLSIFSLLQLHPTDSIFLLGALLSIIGYGTKAGIFPMYTWLPDANGKAPAPVSAIFSAVLEPASLYPLIRIFEIFPNYYLSLFAFSLGFLSVATAAIIAGSQTIYNRLFAYSSIENMGMSLIGISLGTFGLFGAIILIFSHALAKSGTFMLTGNILHRFKTKKIEDVKNMINLMPKTGLFFFFGSLAVTGAPPFATFVGELIILSKVIQIYGYVTGAVLFAFLCIAFLFINNKVISMVFSESDKQPFIESKFVYVPMISISLSLLFLIAIPFLYSFLGGIIK